MVKIDIPMPESCWLCERWHTTAFDKVIECDIDFHELGFDPCNELGKKSDGCPLMEVQE